MILIFIMAGIPNFFYRRYAVSFSLLPNYIFEKMPTDFKNFALSLRK